MKILLIGHKPYVGWLCQGLLKNGFLDINPIDLIVVNSVQKKTRKKSKLKNILEKLGKLSLHKLRLKLALKKYNRQNDDLKGFFSLNDEIPETVQIKYIDYSNFFESGFTANYDLLLVATYGGKIANSIFEGPAMGTWNIHPSVLPELKGGYPTLIQALNSNYNLGTTLHTMTDKIDEGKIVAQQNRPNNSSLPNHILLRTSAFEAAGLLRERQKYKFKPDTDVLISTSPSVCKKIHQPNWYLGNYDAIADIQALVNAYCVPHMFPFIYYFQGLNLIQLLSIGKGIEIKGFESRILFRNLSDPHKAELIFFGKSYPLLAYINNGKFFERAA